MVIAMYTIRTNFLKQLIYDDWNNLYKPLYRTRYMTNEIKTT